MPTLVVCVAVMFCFVLPDNEADRKIYKTIQQKTLAAALYQTKWLIYEHIFEAEYFMYIAFEGNYNGLLSLDVILIKTGDNEIHKSARYCVKYTPCLSLDGAIKRDTVGCEYKRMDCMHNSFADRFLRLAMQNILNYLYREGYSENPNIDALYHMKELARQYYTIVSERLIMQVIHTVSILYISNSVLTTCSCNMREDCVCVSITDYFCVKK